MIAVPAEVNCAVLMSAGAFKQTTTVASQTLTVPAVTGTEPDVITTVAVNVTTVPEATGEAGESVSVVVVGAPAACATGTATEAAIAIIAAKRIQMYGF